MTKMTIKRLGVLSVAKTQGIIGLGLGLIIGVIYGLIIMLFGAFGAMMATSQRSSSGTSSAGGMAAGGIIGGLLAMVGIPIAYSIMSFIGGAIGAVIYNLAARITGGIQLDFDVEPSYGAPPQQQPYANRY